MTEAMYGSKSNGTSAAWAGLETYNQQIVGQGGFGATDAMQKMLDDFHNKTSASQDAVNVESVHLEFCCEDDIFRIEKLGSGAEAKVRLES